jgi:hypothetical protein
MKAVQHVRVQLMRETQCAGAMVAHVCTLYHNKELLISELVYRFVVRSQKLHKIFIQSWIKY